MFCEKKKNQHSRVVNDSDFVRGSDFGFSPDDNKNNQSTQLCSFTVIAFTQ